MDMNDWYMWNTLIQAWDRQHPPSPKFTKEPMTPEQKKIWDIYYGSLTNPIYQGNMPLVNSIARGVATQGPPIWNSPKTSTGETGYGGNGGFDWTKYLLTAPGGTGTPSGTPITTTPTNTPPGGTATRQGDPGAGGGPGSDPFRNWPDPHASGNTNVSDWKPSSLPDVVSRYGKSVAEIVSGFMALNPVLGIKGAWDAYQAWKNGGSDPSKLPTTNRFGKGSGVNLTPGDSPGNNPWDTFGQGPGNTVTYSDNPWNNPGFEDFFGGGGDTPISSGYLTGGTGPKSGRARRGGLV